MRCPHTHYSRGAKIRIVLRSGEIVTGKFIERRSRFVRLDSRKVMTMDIRSMNRLAPKAEG
jgi:hypothetical protein